MAAPSTLTRRAYLAALESYAPAAEELYPGLESAAHPRRLRAWKLASLYLKVYGLLAGELRPGAAVLDLGAWPGTFLRLCRHVFWPKLDLRLVGAGLPQEPGPERPATAPGGGLVPLREALAADRITFIDVDLDGCHAGDEPLPTTEQFDVVTCMEVIEHLHTPYRLAWAIGRLLKPGGVAVVETNNVAYLAGVPRLLRGRSNLDWMLADFASTGPGGHERHPHIRFYSLDELAHLLAVHGLAVERREAFYWIDPGEGVLKRAAKRVLQACWRSTSAYIVVKGRKPASAQ